MGLVDRLKKEFPLEDEWLGFEIYPETPDQGVLLADVFPQDKVERMYARLRATAEPYGIAFGNVTLLSNSRMALEAGEYARDAGVFHQFHENMFRAYFTELKDIGSLETILAVGAAVGIEPDSLRTALENGRYAPAIAEARRRAETYAVRAVPTFIINQRERVVGIQPLDTFRRILHNQNG